MKRDRNHEGYHDPTACRAVRKTAHKPPRRSRNWDILPGPLTHYIAENEAFQRAREVIEQGR